MRRRVPASHVSHTLTEISDQSFASPNLERPTPIISYADAEHASRRRYAPHWERASIAGLGRIHLPFAFLYSTHLFREAFCYALASHSAASVEFDLNMSKINSML
jgi:hypothetical protein